MPTASFNIILAIFENTFINYVARKFNALDSLVFYFLRPILFLLTEMVTLDDEQYEDIM